MTSWGKNARKWLRFESQLRVVKIVPDWLIDSLVEELNLDENAKKLSFISFLRFIHGASTHATLRKAFITEVSTCQLP